MKERERTILRELEEEAWTQAESANDLYGPKSPESREAMARWGAYREVMLRLKVI